jgi:hypothetical protein
MGTALQHVIGQTSSAPKDTDRTIRQAAYTSKQLTHYVPVLFVQKPGTNGSLCFCVDYRALNQISKKD